MKTLLSLLCWFIVLVSQSVFGAITAFYHGPGPGGSYLSPTTTTVQADEETNFGVPEIFRSDFLTIFVFRMEDTDTGILDFIVFTPPPGETIEVGDFFLGHTSPNPGRGYAHVGFDWTTGESFLVASTSFVRVLEAQYEEGGALTSVAFDFELFEETEDSLQVNYNIDPSSFGSFRYNSSIPISCFDPEPAPSLLLGMAGIIAFSSRRRR